MLSVGNWIVSYICHDSIPPATPSMPPHIVIPKWNQQRHGFVTFAWSSDRPPVLKFTCHFGNSNAGMKYKKYKYIFRQIFYSPKIWRGCTLIVSWTTSALASICHKIKPCARKVIFFKEHQNWVKCFKGIKYSFNMLPNLFTQSCRLAGVAQAALDKKFGLGRKF